jgi:hypothetical protein
LHSICSTCIPSAATYVASATHHGFSQAPLPSWARNEIRIGGAAMQELPRQLSAYGLHARIIQNLAAIGIEQLFDVQVRCENSLC